jgi:hypothetical protein
VTENEVEVEVPWISDDYIWNMAFDCKGLATNKWFGMLDLTLSVVVSFKTKSLTAVSPWNRRNAEATAKEAYNIKGLSKTET